MSFLDLLEIPITCPLCSHSGSILVGRMKVDPDISCTNCERPFPLKRDDVLREVNRIETEINGLRHILLRRVK